MLRTNLSRASALVAIDIIVLSIVAAIILFTRSQFSQYHVLLNEIVLFILSSVTAAIFFTELRLYEGTMITTGARQLVALGKGMVWIGILQAVAIVLIKDPDILDYSRGNILLYVAGGWSALAATRMGIVRPLVRRRRLLSAERHRVAIVGAGSAGHRLAAQFTERADMGFDLDCFIDDDPAKLGRRLLGHRVVGAVDSLQRVISERGVQEIFVAINTVGYDRLLQIIAACRATGLPVTVTANHFRIVHNRVASSTLPLADSVTLRPLAQRRVGRIAKRTFDIVSTLVIILLLAPLIVGIALWVALDSPGGVFYRARVVGRNGNVFTWYKFRTMVVHRSEEVHRDHVAKIIRENRGTAKLVSDSRVTRSGRLLRRYSLDELPQLINVLRGEMSLIGPRPCLPYEYEQFADWHRRRFAVTPGLTGLWQIIGRNRTDVTFNDAIILDLYYIENQSFWLDLQIILKTIPVVLLGRGGA